MGMSGKGGRKSETSKQAPTQKTKAGVNRRQNNKMLRQSSIVPRPQHHAIAVPIAMQNSHKDNVHSSAAGNQPKQKKSKLSLSPAQRHLPALHLFWVSFFVGVQLTSLLLISPGLLSNTGGVKILQYLY